MFKCLLLVGLCVVQVLSQYDYVSECPEDNGTFADALQCDRYYECQDGEVLDQLCPDGLVFDDRDAKCGFPFSVDCTGRPDRQDAQPQLGCPRRNGYFSVPDEKICDKFNFCVDGRPNTVTCPGGLIFDQVLGRCAHSDQTKRIGCTSADLFGFQCPEGRPFEHSRHPDTEDCHVFYLCIAGKARKNGCSEGKVFNPDTLSCERQDNVEGPCRNWFNQTYLDSIYQSKAVPSAITGNRVVSQENRRRPSMPIIPRRPSVVESQFPEEPLPQQLLDLDREQNVKEQATQSQVFKINNRGRVRSQVPRRQVPRRPAQQQEDINTPQLQRG